jgi:DNA-binding NarL/FixJ family response regulator
VRVVLAEDLALLRDGLSRLLEAHDIDVVAAVDNAPALLRAVREQTVDLAVVDVRMPPTFTNEGLKAAIDVRAGRPSFPVVVLSQYVEPLYAKELLASGEGSIGYLLKDRITDVRAFIDAVRQVAAGGTVLDPQVVSAILTRAARDAPLTRLSERETEVLGLIAQGRSNAAIAARLFVSEKAIGKHTTSIFTKLDLPLAADDNRRVLAVLTYLQGGHGRGDDPVG